MKNNAHLTRFEAFTLYKSYEEKAKEQTSSITRKIYEESAQKWLDIAAKIERENSDNQNKHFEELMQSN